MPSVCRFWPNYAKGLLLITALLSIVHTPGDFPHEFSFQETVGLLSDTFSLKAFGNELFPNSPVWGVLRFLSETEGSRDIIIYGSSSPILTWYGNYTNLPIGSNGILALNLERIDYLENSTLLHERFRRIGVDYVYVDHPFESGCINTLFRTINEDSQHFRLLYSDGDVRLWRVT